MTTAQDLEAAEKFAKEFDVLAHTRTDNWIEEFQRCFLAGIAHASQARRLPESMQNIVEHIRAKLESVDHGPRGDIRFLLACLDRLAGKDAT